MSLIEHLRQRLVKSQFAIITLDDIIRHKYAIRQPSLRSR